MGKIKITLLTLVLLIVTGFKVDNNVEGLSIKFRKISEDYMKIHQLLLMLNKITLKKKIF